ncbi:MAG TPA: PP2C family serine/threonine-protein phosphatase [Blastocatellia bacterium]|nr:PP2C family serine/threonine-protein phosphatase [Blastocatellia bacterium]
MYDLLVSIFARTDVGMHRAGNEDAFLVADLTTGNVGLGPDMSTHRVGERGSLMIVSDGMGGAAHGEVASEMAVATICDSLMDEPAEMEAAERLRLATEAANQRIWDRSQESLEHLGMGATVTAVMVQGTSAYIAQVGDSRAYLVRNDRIKQLTKDQSWAQMLFDSGAVNLEQMAAVPQNVIMQALGTQPDVKVAMSAIQLFRNDCMILCSDGLSNKVEPDELCKTVQESEDLTEACRLLIERANERGGEDNITVVIARFDGESLESANTGNSITASFNPISEEYFDQDALAEYAARRAENRDESTSPSETTDTTVAQQQDSAVPAVEDHPANRFTEAFPQLGLETGEAPTSPFIRRGFLVIVVIGIVSMLLLLATAYFFYDNYIKDHPRELQQQNTSTPQG